MQTETRKTIRDATAFGRVAVVYGGLSPERDISLLTGEAVLSALQEKGVDAHGVEAAEDLTEGLARGGFGRGWGRVAGQAREAGGIWVEPGVPNQIVERCIGPRTQQSWHRHHISIVSGIVQSSS